MKTRSMMLGVIGLLVVATVASAADDGARGKVSPFVGDWAGEWDSDDGVLGGTWQVTVDTAGKFVGTADGIPIDPGVIEFKGKVSANGKSISVSSVTIGSWKFTGVNVNGKAKAPPSDPLTTKGNWSYWGWGMRLKGTWTTTATQFVTP